MAELRFAPAILQDGLTNRATLIGFNDPEECQKCPVLTCKGREASRNPTVAINEQLSLEGWKEELKNSVCEIVF